MNAQGANGNNAVVGIQDAFNFFDMIQTKYAQEPHFYRYFVSIINEYKYKRIRIAGLVSRVKILFRHSPDLLQEFNRFLPPHHQINIAELSADEE